MSHGDTLMCGISVMRIMEMHKDKVGTRGRTRVALDKAATIDAGISGFSVATYPNGPAEPGFVVPFLSKSVSVPTADWGVHVRILPIVSGVISASPVA